jgi:hypothetical protein
MKAYRKMETPRTDAATFCVSSGRLGGDEMVVLAEVARELEEELEALRAGVKAIIGYEL